MLGSEKTWKLEAVLLLGAGMLFSMSIGGVLTFSVRKYMEWLSLADERFAQFLIGTVSLQGATLILMHFFLRYHKVTWREFFGLNKPLGQTLFRAALTVALATPLVLILAGWCEQIILTYQDKVELQSAVKVLEIAISPGRRALFTFASIVLAPMAEEMLFRGVLYPVIKEQGYPRLALIISSVLFSAIHLNQLAFVPFVVLAMILVWLYERTGSLLAPIIAHAGFNAVNVIFYTVRNSS